MGIFQVSGATPDSKVISVNLILDFISFIIFEYIYYFNSLYVLVFSAITPATLFAIKLVAVLLFLIAVRGGLPRFRYDYLTILGWSKFLSTILIVFLLLLSTYIIL